MKNHKHSGWLLVAVGAAVVILAAIAAVDLNKGMRALPEPPAQTVVADQYRANVLLKTSDGTRLLAVFT